MRYATEQGIPSASTRVAIACKSSRGVTDAERLAVINNAYKSLLNYRNLVNYYTRKNISVSYLRAKKKNDTDRVLALYGSADERYW